MPRRCIGACSNTAQRPRASSSRSRPPGRARSACIALLNARGRHRLGHTPDETPDACLLNCSTPEGVIVSVTRSARTPTTAPRSSAQRPRASSSRSLRKAILDHRAEICSTPEGVIVSVTADRFGDTTGFLGCSTPEGVIVSVTRESYPSPEAVRVCSTPEGVIVSVTSGQAHFLAWYTPAQRPRASSSRSRGRRSGPWPGTRLLNARGRHRLGHADHPALGRGDGELLNARGRHRLGHPIPRRCPAPR